MFIRLQLDCSLFRNETKNISNFEPFLIQFMIAEYVKSLEKECRELKSEKRGLEERLSTLAQSIYSEGGTGSAIKVDLSENDAVKSHIQSLNDTIGKTYPLRTRKALMLYKV